MRNNKKTLAALAIVGVVAAGGSAFTAGNTVPDTKAGYGTSTITGATATSLDYTLSADGTTITDADLVFAGDLRDMTVQAGFGTGASTSCTEGAYTAADALLGIAESTAFSCSGFNQSTSTAETFNVAVSS